LQSVPTVDNIPVAKSGMALLRAAAASRGWLHAYNGLLETKPLPTKILTSLTIFGVCETTAQLITSDTAKENTAKGTETTLRERFSDVNWRQVAGFSCFAFYNAPMMHTFFGMAAKQGLSLPTRVIVTSVVVDPINISVAMMLSAVNKGKTIEEAFATWYDRFVPTMQNSFCFWPPAHLINNFFVPVQYRVLGFTTGSLVWNTYLCWMMQQAEDVATRISLRTEVTKKMGQSRESQSSSSPHHLQFSNNMA
jgi:hypothetical protein